MKAKKAIKCPVTKSSSEMKKSVKKQQLFNSEIPVCIKQSDVSIAFKKKLGKTATQEVVQTSAVAKKKTAHGKRLTRILLSRQLIYVRKLAKQAKIHSINQRTKNLHQLEKKKGNDKQLQKNVRKLQRLRKEISLLKKLNRDDVARFALSEVKDLDSIINNASSSMSDRAKARVAKQPKIHEKVEKFRQRYPTWQKDVPRLLPKIKPPRPNTTGKAQSVDATQSSDDGGGFEEPDTEDSDVLSDEKVDDEAGDDSDYSDKEEDEEEDVAIQGSSSNKVSKLASKKNTKLTGPGTAAKNKQIVLLQSGRGARNGEAGSDDGDNSDGRDGYESDEDSDGGGQALDRCEAELENDCANEVVGAEVEDGEFGYDVIEAVSDEDGESKFDDTPMGSDTDEDDDPDSEKVDEEFTIKELNKHDLEDAAEEGTDEEGDSGEDSDDECEEGESDGESEDDDSDDEKCNAAAQYVKNHQVPKKRNIWQSRGQMRIKRIKLDNVGDEEICLGEEEEDSESYDESTASGKHSSFFVGGEDDDEEDDDEDGETDGDEATPEDMLMQGRRRLVQRQQMVSSAHRHPSACRGVERQQRGKFRGRGGAVRTTAHAQHESGSDQSTEDSKKLLKPGYLDGDEGSGSSGDEGDHGGRGRGRCRGKGSGSFDKGEFRSRGRGGFDRGGRGGDRGGRGGRGSRGSRGSRGRFPGGRGGDGGGFRGGLDRGSSRGGFSRGRGGGDRGGFRNRGGDRDGFSPRGRGGFRGGRGGDRDGFSPRGRGGFRGGRGGFDGESRGRGRGRDGPGRDGSDRGTRGGFRGGARGSPSGNVHPSWAAKKKQSPAVSKFEGTKITFD